MTDPKPKLKRRPTKDTPERRKVILSALAQGNTRTATCAVAGITLETLACWARSDPEFSVALRESEAKAELAALKTIKNAMPMSWQAAAWWLERRRPDEWGKVDRVEIVLREQAERLAKEIGCTPDDLIKEAEAILAGHA